MNDQQIKNVVNKFKVHCLPDLFPTTYNGAVVYVCITPEELEKVISDAYKQGFESGQIFEQEAQVY